MNGWYLRIYYIMISLIGANSCARAAATLSYWGPRGAIVCHLKTQAKYYKWKLWKKKLSRFFQFEISALKIFVNLKTVKFFKKSPPESRACVCSDWRGCACVRAIGPPTRLSNFNESFKNVYISVRFQSHLQTAFTDIAQCLGVGPYTNSVSHFTFLERLLVIYQ